MSKVCFIGPYGQKDGWGRAAQDYCIALSRMPDHKTSFKRVQTTLNMDCEIPQEITQNEIQEFNVPDHGFDIIIQNFLPSNFIKVPNTKNIGLFYSETINFAGTNWIEKCNTCMDAIIVPTEFEHVNLLNDGVKIPIYIVPMPMKLTSNKVEKNREFTFYFIGEFSDRKNIEYVVIEYLTSFTRSDDILLIIKTSNLNVDQYNNYIHQKYRLPTENLPSIKWITDYISDAEIQNIHDRSHCFVSGSKGESTCRPLIQALYSNNFAIVTKNTGMDDNPDMYKIPKLFTVKSEVERCGTLNPPISYIYNGLQNWYSPIPYLMSHTMKYVYDISQYEEKYQCCQNFLRDKYSYSTVAEVLNSVINQEIGV